MGGVGSTYYQIIKALSVKSRDATFDMNFEKAGVTGDLPCPFGHLGRGDSCRCVWLFIELQVEADPHLPGGHLVQQEPPRDRSFVLQLFLDGRHRNLRPSQEV